MKLLIVKPQLIFMGLFNNELKEWTVKKIIMQSAFSLAMWLLFPKIEPRVLTPANQAFNHSPYSKPWCPFSTITLNLPTPGNGQREVRLGMHPPFTRTLGTAKEEEVLASVSPFFVSISQRPWITLRNIFHRPSTGKEYGVFKRQLYWVAGTPRANAQHLWTCLLEQSETAELVHGGSSQSKVSFMLNNNKECTLQLCSCYFTICLSPIILASLNSKSKMSCYVTWAGPQN